MRIPEFINRFQAICLFVFLLIALAAFPAEGADMDGHLLLQRPALSQTHIVFVFAGDLWSVPRAGGEAKRLTSSLGFESNPVFSPDGSQIAFTGEYDGNVDVFIMPAGGGVPQRLTWHPSPDSVLGWTPDGRRVLFTSGRNAYSRFSELYTAGLDGGLEEKLPLPMGFEASYSPDGSRIAYVPLSRAFTAWKRYRGGRATPIWIASLADSRIEKLPRENSNDFNPMWVGDKVYFLSDRNGAVTLFAYDTKSKKVSRVIENGGLDLKSAAAGPGAIVYEQFGSFNLYDLKTGKTSPVPVTVRGDMPDVREKFVRVGDRLTNAGLSPNAARAVFEARGEIITVPAEKGDARNLTQTTGVMERDPAWSPDGKTIAYFSDESGEYMLHLKPQSGAGETVKITLGEKPSFYFSPRWSPDSKKIAYMDCHLTLWYVDVVEKKPVRVAKERYLGGAGNLVPAWSPDSKWLAYTRSLQNYMGAVFLYSTESGKSQQITDGMSDAGALEFDADGKYLYFAASTDSGQSLQPDIHSLSRPVTRAIYLVVLAKDEPSPFAPESDEEKGTEEKKAAEGKAADQKVDIKKDETKKAGELKAEDKKAEEKKAAEAAKSPASGAKAVTVKIDFDGILQRILAVPLPARNYTGLLAGKGGTLLAIESAAFLPGIAAAPGNTVHRYDLKVRRADVVINGVGFFGLARNGEKYLYSQGGRWYIAALRPMPPAGAPAGPPSPPSASGANALATDTIQIRVNPGEEWRQMYHEAWRIEREFFYDPGAHGYDLAAAEIRYAPYLENVVSRSDLNYLFAEMLGGLEVGHLGVGGGDIPTLNRVPAGLLGADYKIENGRYRFARIYNGENWNPGLRAPLTQPGINIAAGDYLLAVNGRDVTARDNIYSFFENTAGKQVLLKVGPTADGKGSREVTVVPVPSETALRNYAWIEDNRRYVDKITGGRVAYVYMPDTSIGGYTNFNRYFFPQVGKDAVIVDERFNAGGALATDIIEFLQRKLLSLVGTRDGEDEAQPQGAIFGPKVMLINEFAGSGGDAMPYYFKAAGVGPLIGKRTWGGLVGRAGAPQLMDGGMVTAPSSGVWSPKGEWIAENVGIAPDIEVEHDPALVRQGKDPQLDKAIEVLMSELAKTPPVKPKRPAFPNHYRK
ncbi:MAG: PDZ domain-containing protein [Candidatus Aminicenantes bacterium]|nr:PDZ domain-containing protein [Candidatus Aminicenantes bacterium]